MVGRPVHVDQVGGTDGEPRRRQHLLHGTIIRPDVTRRQARPHVTGSGVYEVEHAGAEVEVTGHHRGRGPLGTARPRHGRVEQEVALVHRDERAGAGQMGRTDQE